MAGIPDLVARPDASAVQTGHGAASVLDADVPRESSAHYLDLERP